MGGGKKVPVRSHYRTIKSDATVMAEKSHATVMAEPVKVSYIPQAAFDNLVKELGSGHPSLELFRVRPAGTGKPIPTKREDGDGGICPHYGVPQHWMRKGINSTNDEVKAGRCGFRRDGHYATKEGYARHKALTEASGRV